MLFSEIQIICQLALLNEINLVFYFQVMKNEHDHVIESICRLHFHICTK